MFASPSIPVAICCALLIGISVSGIGFNVMHDGGHKSFSASKNINRLMAYSADLIGASSYHWKLKHNLLHHTYVNIDGYDSDLHVGGLARFAPSQPRYFFHRFQHWYMWILYSFIKVKWSYFDDYETWFKGKLGKQPIKRAKGKTLFWMIVGKVFFYTWALVLPLLFHPIAHVLCLYAIATAVSGLTLAVVFSLAHMSEGADFPLPHQQTNTLEDDWMIHQLRTTVNFAKTNRLLSWYVGGLNYQIEHHLFPTISHVHYPALSSIVEKTCKEYGLPYLYYPTMREGIIAHYHLLRTLGNT